MHSSVWANRIRSLLCVAFLAVASVERAISDDSTWPVTAVDCVWNDSADSITPTTGHGFSLIDHQAFIALDKAIWEMDLHPVTPVAFECEADSGLSKCGCDSYCCDCYDPHQPSYGYGLDSDAELDWINGLRVGYDHGFLIASQHSRNLGASEYPFQLRFNGWGQLRHTVLKSTGAEDDQNQFQLKRGRLIFSGVAFNPDFHFLIQLDGRSSSGDDVRLLDYYLSYDVGHAKLGLRRGQFGLRTGKYKMPFTLARWLSGKELEFTDRSVASTFFDVNRSFAWGIYGASRRFVCPLFWEAAIFNGLVTGGAETGSTGSLDSNFAYSARIHSYPTGKWGAGELADFENHQRLATRIGLGYASSRIDSRGTTEFNTLRVVDSGKTLASLLSKRFSDTRMSYSVNLFCTDYSVKYRGLSGTLEYYFRSVADFEGIDISSLFDHGFWLQYGYFISPANFQLLTRWSRVVGDSGTLGGANQSSDEIAAGAAWYFRENHAKAVVDVSHLNAAPIDSSSLDIVPGERGWLYRCQIQFSF